ncbi:MAG TPA: 50S ribosomal protein L25 [Blastocatellia bacterium]|nr:50S ribosomal protein L25 [Blastocatellia bacterium]
MSSQITIDAKLREGRGKNEARRLRAQGLLPVTVYGHGDPVAAAVDAKKLASIFRTQTGHNTIFNLNLDNGETPAVIIKDWDADPVKGKLVHADLYRLKLDEVMRVTVSVHLVGTPYGVKTDGGLLEIQTHELDIECLPGDIPEHISVDVSELRLNQHISVSDLKLGDKIKVLNDSDTVLASVNALRTVEETATPAAGAEAGAAEPEVIKKGKTEEAS